MPANDVQWTDGARALAQYLRDHGLTMYAFCKRAGLDYAKVYRVLDGEGGRGRRTSIDFADDIERATDGEVRAALWRSDTLSDVQPAETPTETTPAPSQTGT